MVDSQAWQEMEAEERQKIQDIGKRIPGTKYQEVLLRIWSMHDKEYNTLSDACAYLVDFMIGSPYTWESVRIVEPNPANDSLGIEGFFDRIDIMVPKQHYWQWMYRLHQEFGADIVEVVADDGVALVLEAWWD